jgi:ATP-binding cassette subfamily B (MDR/TAP) protein 1
MLLEDEENTASVSIWEMLTGHATTSDKIYLVVGIITAILSGANQPANLIIFGEVLNSFNAQDESKRTEMINFLAIMYVVVGAQMFLTQFIQNYCMASFSAKQTRNIREEYFKSLIKQPVSYFDVQDQGMLATSVMESTLIIQDGMGEKFGLGVQFSCSFFFGLIVALYYAWQLALLVCAIVPVAGFVIAVLAGVLTKSTEAATGAYNLAGSIATEALGGIRTVAGFNGEKHWASAYADKVQAGESAGLSKQFATGSLIGAIQFILWCAYALGLWFGARLISTDMEGSIDCNYRTNASGGFEEPSGDCITGGSVMTCFFAILFGGLQLGQAIPAISSVTSAKVRPFISLTSLFIF